jgi:undecaprenyl-phosphate galactose phosphotransferase
MQHEGVGSETFQVAELPRIHWLEKNVRPLLGMLALFLIDYAMIVLSVGAIIMLRSDVLPWLFPSFISVFNQKSVSPFILNAMIPFVFIAFIAYEGLYTRRLPFWQGAERLFKATFFAFMLLLFLFFLMGEVADKSRLVFLFLWLFVFFAVASGRWAGKKILAKIGLWSKPVLLIGAGQTAEILLSRFLHDPAIGYRVIGILEDEPWKRPLCKQVPYLGGFDDALEVVKRTGVRDVMVTAPGLGKEQLLDLLYKLQPFTHRISFVPDLFGVPLSNLEMDTVVPDRTLLLHVRNNLAEWRNHFLKRSIDIVAGSLIFLAVSPVLLLIALAICMETPGAPVFAHWRVGRSGRPFPCLKFRTMVRNSAEMLETILCDDPSAKQEWENDFKLRCDPRITRVGEFLRRTSLDELPQLLNVVIGQMSLVGPRPIIHEEIAKYGEAIADYYLVRPGLTGLWQVSGRNDLSYEQRVELDSWYVRNWSPWFDLTILFRTIGVVLGRKGAY